MSAPEQPSVGAAEPRVVLAVPADGLTLSHVEPRAGRFCARCGAKAQRKGCGCAPMVLSRGWYVWWPGRGLRAVVDLDAEQLATCRAVWDPLPWESGTVAGNAPEPSHGVPD